MWAIFSRKLSAWRLALTALQIHQASQGDTNNIMFYCGSQVLFMGISVENECWRQTLNRASKENPELFISMCCDQCGWLDRDILRLEEKLEE